MKRAVSILAVVVGLLASPTALDAPAAARSAATAPEAALGGITQMDGGGAHTCARLSSGQARCWGYNLFRQVGDNSIAARTLPTAVLNTTGSAPLGGVAQVDAGGNHSCARLTNRQVRCWGFNGEGQLGPGNDDPQDLPVAVAGVGAAPRLNDVAGVTVGFNHTCARLRNGQARCWGDNSQLQIGDDSNVERDRPVVVRDVDGVGALTGVTQISAGTQFTCARLNTGRAVCWGNNSNNQLGDGTVTDRDLPTFVSNPSGTGPLTGVASVHAGDFSACARLSNGQARCWGSGFLGNNTSSQESRPVGVLNGAGTGALTGIQQLSMGGNHACVRLSLGRVRCWGANVANQIGDRTATNRLLPVAPVNPAGTLPLRGVANVALGGSHSCHRLPNGEALCGGLNSSGQLGDGTTAPRDRPIGVRR